VLGFIKKLFKPKQVHRSSSIDVRTAPLSEEQLKSVTRQETRVLPRQYQAACAQSIGLQREHNEDTLFVLNTILGQGNDDVPVGIFIIADGMGGHQHGEVASAVATRSMAEYVITRLYRLFLGLPMETQSESLQEILEGGVAEAQQAVAASVPGGGTTLTAALTIGNQIIIAHVGDSRAYTILPGGGMGAITKDHSLVQRLIDLGQITQEEAHLHPQRNVLYRAIGQAEPIHPDIHMHEFPQPGYLLLCSDGLWGVVPETEIFNIVQSQNDLSAACQAMVDAANKQGGPDNISVILVRYPG
jgi:PPM family protein phosphatase